MVAGDRRFLPSKLKIILLPWTKRLKGLVTF